MMVQIHKRSRARRRPATARGGGEVRYFGRKALALRPDVPGAACWAVELDRVMLTYFDVRAGARFERHSHEAEQITMVLEGSLVFECDDRPPIRVEAGEVIAIPSGVPHAVSAGPEGAKAVDAWSPPRTRYSAGDMAPRAGKAV